MKRNGKFIVFEGIDGSGKTTQFLLLQNALKQRKIQFKALDFPRYQQSQFGALAGRMLSGEFGLIEKINPYLAALPYMVDQALAASQIKEWRAKGFFVLSNRYVTSNFGHQAGKFIGQARKIFFDWLISAGYSELGIIKEDIVLFFDTPPHKTKNLIAGRARERDAAEISLAHQKRSYEAFCQAVALFPHWIRVKCLRNGEVLSEQEIHKSVLTILGV